MLLIFVDSAMDPDTYTLEIIALVFRNHRKYYNVFE